MNAYKVAREYFPKMSRRFIDYFLWNETAFPFCDESYLRQQLEEGLQRLMMYRRSPSPSIVGREFR